MKTLFPILFCFASTALAGIGDDLNTALRNKSNPQFTPLGNRVMLVTCTDSGFFVSFYFIDGIEEGLSFSRANKGPIDTKTLNRLAQSYAPAGQWHREYTSKGISYWRCNSLGLWSHYDSISLKNWPTYFLYTDKLSAALGKVVEPKRQATATYSPDHEL
jgi:hypothetical protein